MTDLTKRSLLKVAAPAPAKPAPLKIAFAYVGPVGDGGWTFAHDNGRKAVEKEFGDKVVTSFVENVPESADAECVLRDMAGQGNKLIRLRPAPPSDALQIFSLLSSGQNPPQPVRVGF